MTCASISGATIIWSSELSPFTILNFIPHTSILSFQPIKVSSATSRSIFCLANFPGNINIIGIVSALHIEIAGMFNLLMHLCSFIRFISSSVIECVSVFQY